MNNLSNWDLWAILCFLLPAAYAALGIIRYYNNKKRITPYWILCIAMAASLFFLTFPLHCVENGTVGAFAEGGLRGLLSGAYAALQSAYHVIRMFTLNGAPADITALLPCDFPARARDLYTVGSTVLFAVAPLLTVGLVLSFFKNIFSHIRYFFASLFKEIHVFSELNAESLALATSIKKGGRLRRTVVFCDIIDRKEETFLDLIGDAGRLGAIFFRKDMDSVHFAAARQSRILAALRAALRGVRNFFLFTLPKKKRPAEKQKYKYHFYLICRDEAEILRHAHRLTDAYGGRADAALYIFSSGEGSRCFLDSYTEAERAAMQMRVERVDDIRFLIYHYLDTDGIELFRAAKEKDGRREISVAVIGFGRYGVELVRALLWYCQLPGYLLKLTVFDRDGQAESHFRARFPEILPRVPMLTPGDMKYLVDIEQDVDVGTRAFQERIEALSPDLTHAFVCLGADEENLSAAITVRRVLTRAGSEAAITTVIYDTPLKERVHCPAGGTDSPVAGYRLRVIGDIESFYATGTVIASRFVEEGLSVHQRWGSDEHGYYMNDYNFYSSLAGALHRKLRDRIPQEDASVFPFYRDGFKEGPLRVEKETLSSMLGNMNTTEALARLSSEMKVTCDLLEAVCAYVYYRDKLTPAARKAVLTLLDSELAARANARKRPYLRALPMLDDTGEYLAGYAEMLERMPGSQKEAEAAGRDAQKKAEADVLREMTHCIAKILTPCDPRETRLALAYSNSMKAAAKETVEAFIGRRRGHATRKETQAELSALREKATCFACIEHIRGNAYMRSEGFSLSRTKTDKPNKLHIDLVPVDRLTLSDCVKDI